VGQGHNLTRGIWSEHAQVFNSQTHKVTRKTTSKTKELGAPGRVKHDVLIKYSVDFLIIDGIQANVWRPWLRTAGAEHRPKMVVIFGEGKDLSTERNMIGKQLRKEMGRWGYHTSYWTMGAWNYGAALNQIRLVTILQLVSKPGPGLPARINLPVRSMGNFLMPMGVPYRARNKRPVQRLAWNESHGPEVIGGSIDGHHVYQIEGAMSDRVGYWIEHPSGIRRLQHQELAKAKGMTDDYELSTNSGGLESICQVTCVHIVTAVLDHLGRWYQGERRNPGRQGTEDSRHVPGDKPQTMWSTDEEDHLDPDWEWEPLDLTEGSEWYKARVKSLTGAIQNLDDPARWLLVKNHIESL
jgi:hypothetical protein